MRYPPESPDILTGGRWVVTARSVRVWMPDAEITQQRPEAHRLIACPTCHARVDQLCRTRTGRHRQAHATRLVAKRCMCGEALAYNRKFCDDCRAAARRENGRIGMANTRARRRAERDAA